MHVIVNFYAPKEIDAIVNMLCQDPTDPDLVSARENPYIRTPYVCTCLWKEREKLGPSNSATHPLRMINTRMITFHNYSCKNHKHYQYSVNQAPNSPFIMSNRVFCIVCTYYSSTDIHSYDRSAAQRRHAGSTPW